MQTEIYNAKPVVKWAGGKRQLLEQFNTLYPDALNNNQIDKYVEPFVGGGAVFFELLNRFEFKEIILNDINEELILTYRIIKEEVDDLIELLREYEEEYIHLSLEKRKDYYYKKRTLFNTEKKEIDYDNIDQNTVKHASNFIFLNRTCFNGLYRQNKKGEFNVPIGRYKKPTICDKEGLETASQSFENCILISSDFEKTEQYIDKRTFVYMDPPYRPLPGTPRFTKYSKADFNEQSQIRLANWFKKLDRGKNKPYLMLSNSNPKNNDPDDDFFEEKYYGFDIKKVYAKRVINSKGAKRGEISELVIRNYR